MRVAGLRQEREGEGQEGLIQQPLLGSLFLVGLSEGARERDREMMG